MTDPTKRTPWQQRLLQSVRTLENPDMGDIIKESSIDDLEWFLQIVEHQLEETPHWISDPDRLHRVQAWGRRVHIMTKEVLHNKRNAARPWVRLRKAAQALFWIIVGAVIAGYIGQYFR